MTTTQRIDRQVALRRLLLDSSDSTADFLSAVQAVIEQLYAESDSECPEGFDALDQAIDEFSASEAEG